MCIRDRGCGVLSFCYQDVTTDDGDFSNGLAGALHADRSQGNAPGKLMMWAWAAMRVLDYGLTIPGASADKTAVAGHSRLGKDVYKRQPQLRAPAAEGYL